MCQEVPVLFFKESQTDSRKEISGQIGINKKLEENIKLRKKRYVVTASNSVTNFRANSSQLTSSKAKTRTPIELTTANSTSQISFKKHNLSPLLSISENESNSAFSITVPFANNLEEYLQKSGLFQKVIRMKIDKRLRRLHKKRDYICPGCDVIFSHKKLYEEHMQNVHHRDKKYQCDFCNQCFPLLVAYKNHMQTHLTMK